MDQWELNDFLLKSYRPQRFSPKSRCDQTDEETESFEDITESLYIALVLTGYV